MTCVCVQECVYCEDAAATPIDEADMEMGELGDELGRGNQNTQNQSTESAPHPNSPS